MRVPHLFNLISDTDNGFWEQNLLKFPATYRTRGTLVEMERILPLPKVIRKALITHFYPQQNGPLDSAALSDILNSTPNKHCLARTYLGRTNWKLTEHNFSLRNFPLCLQPMEDLGLDVVNLAASMGKAFAIMHWGGGVNGDDVEFVLGTSEIQGPGAGALDFQQRAVGFYLLDFGQCETVDLSKEPDQVYQEFKGAMVTGDNQYFIPHYDRSRKLFTVFKEGYMTAGQAVLKDKGLDTKFSMEDFMKEYEEYAEDFI